MIGIHRTVQSCYLDPLSDSFGILFPDSDLILFGLFVPPRLAGIDKSLVLVYGA